MTMDRTLWRYELEVDDVIDSAEYVVKTALYDPSHDDTVARCWSEDVAKEIVRLHNEDVIRRA